MSEEARTAFLRDNAYMIAIVEAASEAKRRTQEGIDMGMSFEDALDYASMTPRQQAGKRKVWRRRQAEIARAEEVRRVKQARITRVA